MQEHFNDSELTIKLLCEISGMSDTYFRRLFSEVYHTTPNKYLTGLRISYAEDLLSGGYYTIERVAQECGFAFEDGTHEAELKSGGICNQAPIIPNNKKAAAASG